MYCEKMLEVIQAVKDIDHLSWEESVLANFHGATEDTYKDFKTSNKMHFISKWRGHFIGHNLDGWYSATYLMYAKQDKAQRVLDSLNKLLEDIS